MFFWCKFSYTLVSFCGNDYRLEMQILNHLSLRKKLKFFIKELPTSTLRQQMVRFFLQKK